MHSAWRDSWTRFTWWVATPCEGCTRLDQVGWGLCRLVSWIQVSGGPRSHRARFWATGHEVHNGLWHRIDQLSWFQRSAGFSAFSGCLPCQIDPNMQTVPYCWAKKLALALGSTHTSCKWPFATCFWRHNSVLWRLKQLDLGCEGVWAIVNPRHLKQRVGLSWALGHSTHCQVALDDGEIWQKQRPQRATKHGFICMLYSNV